MKKYKLCDNIAPNLLLIKDDKDNIFGGFTNVSWENKEIKKRMKKVFYFQPPKIKNIFQKTSIIIIYYAKKILVRNFVVKIYVFHF